MTKEDYMNLSKERLAELLAERDAIPFVPLQTWQNPCANPNYPCSNPYHDCINCPRIGDGCHYTTTAGIFDEKYLQKKIEQATPKWKGVDTDEFLNEIRGEKKKLGNYGRGYKKGYADAVEKACDVLAVILEDFLHGGDSDIVIALFQEKMEEEK